MGEFNFQNAPWHDAELLAVTVDRRSPGVADVVRLDVVWPDDSTSVVQFQDCYRFTCSMNFAVVAVETILEASLLTSSDGLDELRKLWERMGVSVRDLKEFRIKTNSTGSDLVVFARRVICSPAGTSE